MQPTRPRLAVMRWIPVMCNYQGYEFGAGRYPDSYCVDGTLHDADSDYLNDEGRPCPICRRDDAIQWWYAHNENSTSGDVENPDWDAINTQHMANAISLVDDIRKNRGIADPALTAKPGAEGEK